MNTFLVHEKQKPRGKKWRKEKMVGKEVGNYKINERIGKGATSHIYLADCNGSTNVCKISDRKFSEILWKEFEILRSLQHDNILKVYDCISCNKVVVMASERVPNGDLHDYILRNWPVKPEIRYRISQQLLSAVDTLHKNGIAHCDLKLENILIDELGDIKIIDFGSALRVSEATYESFAYIATTPEYLPPELFCSTADDTYDIRAIDEWSVGVILFIILTGRFPFGEVDQSRIAKYIKKIRSASSFELRPNEEQFLYIERDYLDLIRGLLDFDPNKRLSVAKVLQMPYYTKSDSLKDIEDEIDKDFESIFDELDLFS